MFSTFMARFSFKPIKNCPGRFVLRGRKVVDLKELGEDLVWAELDKCSRDAVWVSKFVDETGGLIVFEKRNNKDRTLVVTLSNTSGFERKMHMLYASLNAFRWVGGAPCPQSFVVLVVLKRSDLFAHRGTGLIRREAVHATQQFLLDENWTLEEAEGAILPLMNVGEKFGFRRMDTTRSSNSSYVSLSSRTGVITLKNLAKTQPDGLPVAFVLLEERSCITSEVYAVKKFDGVSLRLVSLSHTLPRGTAFVEEINEVCFYFRLWFCVSLQNRHILLR